MGTSRLHRAVLAGVGAAMLLTARPVLAECRLALSLAMDVSRSVDSRDYAIQRNGLLAALVDPDIRAAMLETGGHVALSIFEWSSREDQWIVMDWTEILTVEDLDAFVARLALHERNSRGNLTALGEAVNFGRQMMLRAPPCTEQVLDVSGDGQNNDGPDPVLAYMRSDFGEIRVNGLAIRTYERDVAAYYRSRVIRGAGAFVEIAEGQKDFPRAIRRKLLRELGEKVIGMDADLAPSRNGG